MWNVGASPELFAPYCSSEILAEDLNSKNFNLEPGFKANIFVSFYLKFWHTFSFKYIVYCSQSVQTSWIYKELYGKQCSSALWKFRLTCVAYSFKCDGKTIFELSKLHSGEMWRASHRAISLFFLIQISAAAMRLETRVHVTTNSVKICRDYAIYFELPLLPSPYIFGFKNLIGLSLAKRSHSKHLLFRQ